MNLQTATREQLVTLESIGDKRADLILQKRREKGSLSIDDLAACTNIPGKVWQDWVRKGVITLSGANTLSPGASAVSPQGVSGMARRMEAMERKMEDLIFELGSEKQKNARERLEREQEISGIKCRAEVDLQVREMEWKREKEAILQRQGEHQLSPAPVEAATGVQAREDPGGMWDNVTRGIYLPPSARHQGGTARSKQRQARGHSKQAGDRFSAGARLFPSSEEEDEISGGSEAEDARSRRRSRHRSRHSRIRSASSSESSPSQDRLRRSVDRGLWPLQLSQYLSSAPVH